MTTDSTRTVRVEWTSALLGAVMSVVGSWHPASVPQRRLSLNTGTRHLFLLSLPASVSSWTLFTVRTKNQTHFSHCVVRPCVVPQVLRLLLPNAPSSWVWDTLPHVFFSVYDSAVSSQIALIMQVPPLSPATLAWDTKYHPPKHNCLRLSALLVEIAASCTG